MSLSQAVPTPATAPPSRPRASAPRPLPDAIGALLLGAGIGAAALGITQGSHWGWADARTVGALAGAALAVAVAQFLAFWLPIGVLIGVGTGAITTRVSTAAALSVAPERFAAAVGLNQTGRQVGGALGVAALAALLDGSGSGAGPFAYVYLFCTLATFAVALTALWLVTKERR